MRFWSEEFFAAAAEAVNSDPRFPSLVTGISTSIIVDCSDKESAFRIQLELGKVSVRPARGDLAEFTFSAPYEEWTRIIRDGLDIRGEVLKGRVKFRGSMPKMLLYLGRVSRMEKEIIQKMRAMGPEF